MKNTLLTGASGFLGKIILSKLGETTTLGRTQLSGNHIISDLQSIPPLETPFNTVIHNAGKAHITPKSKEEKDDFFKVNLDGTSNLLAALSRNPPKQFIFISTIAVYGKDKGELISEQETPRPNTPYGESKWLAEQAVSEWAEKYTVSALILRLPLVVGVNPPGNLGAIQKAIQKGYYFKIRNNPAKKSMVLANDISNLISNIPSNISGTYNLVGSTNPTFTEVEEAIEKRVVKKSLQLSPTLVKGISKVGDLLQKLGLPAPLTSSKYKKITYTLTFDDTKARKELNWNPNPVIPFIEKHL